MAHLPRVIKLLTATPNTQYSPSLCAILDMFILQSYISSLRDHTYNNHFWHAWTFRQFPRSLWVFVGNAMLVMKWEHSCKVPCITVKLEHSYTYRLPLSYDEVIIHLKYHPWNFHAQYENASREMHVWSTLRRVSSLRTRTTGELDVRLWSGRRCKRLLSYSTWYLQHGSNCQETV